MGTLILVDSNRDLLSLVVFPTTFAKAYVGLQEGSAYKINYSINKEDDLIFQEVVTV